MTVAIIGAGVMGETLLSGLLRAGRRPGDLLVGEKRRERAHAFRSGTASRWCRTSTPPGRPTHSRWS